LDFHIEHPAILSSFYAADENLLANLSPEEHQALLAKLFPASQKTGKLPLSKDFGEYFRFLHNSFYWMCSVNRLKFEEHIRDRDGQNAMFFPAVTRKTSPSFDDDVIVESHLAVRLLRLVRAINEHPQQPTAKQITKKSIGSTPLDEAHRLASFLGTGDYDLARCSNEGIRGKWITPILALAQIEKRAWPEPFRVSIL
jgi:hypothetical protein